MSFDFFLFEYCNSGKCYNMNGSIEKHYLMHSYPTGRMPAKSSAKSRALKSRYMGMTEKERCRANKYRRWIKQLICIQAVDQPGGRDEITEELEDLTVFLILLYLRTTRRTCIPKTNPIDDERIISTDTIPSQI